MASNLSTATATIEPAGRRAKSPRDHSITVVINPGAIADKSQLAATVRKSLEGFAPIGGEPDRRRFLDAAGEGSAICAGKPSVDAVDRLRAVLAGAGLRVTLRERRECGEPGCTRDSMVGWNRVFDVPVGWYSNVICGKHNYRTCATCGSVFLLTSTNSTGQAPSVRCEVCGAGIIAWGGSKIWNAELVKRGRAPSASQH